MGLMSEVRRITTRSWRVTAAAMALGLAGVACSIEAPDIKLVSQGGGAAGTDSSSLAPGAGTAGTEGTAGFGGATSAAGLSAAQKSCQGVATDVGVSPTSIRLGSNFAVSGPVSNISGPILKGVQSYFNKVNEAGGVYGRKIELKWYDDGWDAQRGKAYIKRLVEQDKVFVLTTVPSSNGLDAAKSYLESKQVPVFGTSGLIESQFKSPMQWPVGTSSKSASRIGLVTMKKLGAKSAAVVWLDLLAGREANDAIVNGIKPIIGVDPKDFLVNTTGYRVSISEPDFGPVWARVQDDTRNWQSAHHKTVTGRPDYVVFAIDPTNAIKALQAAENVGFRPRVGWGGAAPLFLNLVPQGSDYAARTGLRAGTSFYPPIGPYANRPAVKEYVKTVRRYYGNSVDLNNPYLEGGYAGAAMTVEVIKRAGPCLTRAAVIRAANTLAAYSAAGLTPPITFHGGSSHYGNIRGLNVQVNDGGDWTVTGDFVTDPFPGRS
jgi:branched-chain amino acid transport system substrate-binding protein